MKMESEPSNSIERFLDAVACTNFTDLKYEIKKLQAIRKWALRQIGADYNVGDQVEIASDFAEYLTIHNGWYPYREALAEGATGIVRKIDFSLHTESWYACVLLDKEWATTQSGRYWHGPVDSTPEGYHLPSKYDQDHYPGGRKGTFMISVEHLRKATVTMTDTRDSVKP